MKEQDLKRKILVERQEINVPKKAIFKAIDAGVRKAETPWARKHRRLKIVGAFALLVIFTSTGFVTGSAQDLLSHFPKVFDFFDGSSVSPTKKNSAEAFIMESGVGYVAGTLSEEADKPAREVKIKPGFYDVTLIKGEQANLMGDILLKGQTFTSYIFYQNNFAKMEGAGAQLKFTPAKLAEEKKVAGKYVFENRLGNFQIGEQIVPGDYEVTVETTSSDYSVMVHTTNNIVEGSTENLKYDTRGNSFTDEAPQTRSMHLAKGSLFTIGNDFKEAKDLKVILTPTEK